MCYVIGIDGGATKSYLKIAALKGHVVYTGTGGPCNINSINKDLAGNNLKELIYSALKASGLEKKDCLCVCLGMAGAGSKERRKIYRGLLNNEFENLIITDDAQAALLGGTGTETGVVLISGTGSICFGRNINGKTHRAGGWGHIIGDEGSGYYIGCKILNSIMKSYDLRNPPTYLTRLVLIRLGIDSPENIIDYVYTKANNKASIASLAKICDEACFNGDKKAEEILNDCADALFEHVDTVIRELDMQNTMPEYRVAYAGSVIKNSVYLLEKLSTLLYSKYSDIVFMPAQNDAAWGCIMIALNELKKMNLN